ncbi:MAG TPA: hypothetical protein HA277_00180 [Methanosphaera sp.]|nr:hypothetical protein [Methanosphaera sp.]
MGKNRVNRRGSTSSGSSAEDEKVIANLTDNAIEWMTHVTDFIDENMTDEEIEYVNNHMESLDSISPDGIYRMENSSRTFSSQNITKGAEFSFDNDSFKAFSKNKDVVESMSLGTVFMGEPVIYHLSKGNAFDVYKQLKINDYQKEEEVWVSEKQRFRVNEVSETTPERLGLDKKQSIPKKTWDKIKSKKIILVEMTEV